MWYRGEEASAGKVERVEKSVRSEVVALKMLTFPLGVARLDRIRNEDIRGTEQDWTSRDKDREARLRWFSHLQRRD